MADKDVRIKLSADTKEAVRSVREFERQVNKLGDLADQGQRRQDGFLSSRQVQMYKRILREMEQDYTTHQKRLEQIEDSFSKRQNGKEQRKLKDLESELRKRQQMLRNAEGGNKWGDQASPIIQEYHRTRLEHAQKAHDAYKNSDELKRALADVTQLEADLNVMRSTVQRLENERNRGQQHAGRIGSMHEMDPSMRHMMSGMAGAIGSTGAVLGMGAYWNYSQSGIDVLRAQERAANTVALQSGAYAGQDIQADGEHRRSIYALGEKSNYSTLETAQLQSTIIQGGTSGNTKALADDTQAMQRFGRAYAIDPNQVAHGGAMLQRMGTLQEGEQQRFANILAGAIAKNGMGGRQEEMLRATVSLAQSVSQGQAQFTQQQFKNVAGLQVALGEAVPTLKGERGASLLANLDQGIKNSDHQADLLMGKGVEFTGLEGMYELEKLQEQGLSNPRNLQLLAKHSSRVMGGNQQMVGFALKEKFGLQLNEYEALKKSGLWDKFATDPNSVSRQDLEKAGASELAKQWATYSNSETGKVDYQTAQGENLKGSHAQVMDEGAKGLNQLWHGMPDWVQHSILPATALAGAGVGMFGGAMLRKIPGAITRRVRPDINGNGGWRSWMDNLKGRFGGGGGGTPPTGGGGGLLGGLKDFGGKMKGFGGKTLDAIGSMGKRIPVAGALLGTGIDRIANPEHSWGRSITKGVGGAVGGILGGGAAIASGLFTGGLGWLGTGAAAVGGGMAGESIADSIYSFFAGDGDKKKKPKKVPTADPTSANEAELSTLKVDKLHLNNKDFADYFDKQSSKKDTETASNGKSKEQVVRIVLEGDIKGMDKKNQDKVSDSISNYFSSGAFSYSNNPFRYNLALDQTRS
jgi:hypothetical protein